MELLIGDKAWSSWSMRPWLALRRAGLPFTERMIRLRRDDTREAAREAGSPTGQVPVLVLDGGAAVWDSLAICEWAAERAPAARLWPAEPTARAVARATASEMHAGFAALRSEFPLDLRARTPKAPSTGAGEELRRLVELWGGLLHRSGGPFLFGPAWTIADAFHTPVATRLRTYAVDLRPWGDNDGSCAAYARRLLAEPEFLDWEAAA